MKFTITTTDETEMKRLLAVRDSLSALSNIQEYLISSEGIPEKDKDAIYDIINEVNLEELWS